jgi:hypothetical protein
MSILSLLFPFGPGELQTAFGRLDLGKIGVTIGEGASSHGANGTVIYRGAAFDFSVVPFTDTKVDHYIFCSSDTRWVHSALTIRLGAAVAAGQMVPAVICALFSLGQNLGSCLGAKATLWSPASVMSGFDYFAEAITQYDNNAAFPSLVCIGFDTSSDNCIRTTGLDWFCGQELVFARDRLPVHEAMRYVVRLVHDMALNGAVENAMEVPGMERRERLEMVPTPDPARLVVQRRYVQNGLNSAG